MRSPLAFLFFLVLPQLGFAELKLSQTQPIPIPQMDLKTTITSKDVEQYVPLDLRETNDAGYIARRVGDRALNQWWNSPEMQGTAIAQTAHSVEKSMKTELNVRSDDPNKVDHKLSFQVQALQSTAVAKYQGWVDARAEYNARSRRSLVEFTQKILKNKDLILSHSATSREDVTSAGVRWAF